MITRNSEFFMMLTFSKFREDIKLSLQDLHGETKIALGIVSSFPRIPDYHSHRTLRIDDSLDDYWEDDAARGKFVSGAKVLTAVPSISQPRSFLSNFSY